MAERLKDKVAIITGTGSGIGRAAAHLFAREGARVVGCDINAERGLAVMNEVRAAGGDMISLQPLDLSNAEGAEALMTFAIENRGGLDILFNNAARAHFAWVEDMDHATFAATIRDEVDVVFHLTRLAWPHLIARGGGSIINTASGAGKFAQPNQGGLAHCAAKGAVLAMTRQYAAEGAQHSIRANTVSPGLTRTAETEHFFADPAWVSKSLARAMLGRAATPEEVAAGALFLASDEAGYVTGADIAIDGGKTAM